MIPDRLTKKCYNGMFVILLQSLPKLISEMSDLITPNTSNKGGHVHLLFFLEVKGILVK